MPAKSKKNYRAMAHSDELVFLAAETHKKVTKGTFVSQEDLDALIRLANDLSRELRGSSLPPPPDTLDPFLLDKAPTVKVPAPMVEQAKEEVVKKGFLGR